MDDGPQEDLRDVEFVEFVEFTTGVGKVRRFVNTVFSNEGTTMFTFCGQEMSSEYFVSPMQVAQVLYIVPTEYDEKMLNEMDEIIKTMTIVK